MASVEVDEDKQCVPCALSAPKYYFCVTRQNKKDELNRVERKVGKTAEEKIKLDE